MYSKKPKTFKFRKQKKPVVVSLPSFPELQGDTQEQLTGMVNDMQASAPEERLANALRAEGIPFMFRMVVGAPKGMPGWKELDFLVETKGLLYALEVDTAFTHQGKEFKDKLHDAIILADREIQSYGTLYPQVFHADGETDLASAENSKAYVKHRFGRG